VSSISALFSDGVELDFGKATAETDALFVDSWSTSSVIIAAFKSKTAVFA
jgi:hypothetical protein